MRTIEDLLREADALTLVNALKVTLIEVKDEVSIQEELHNNLSSSRDRTRKLLRKADNQYRLIAKLAQRIEGGAIADTLSIEDNSSELEELMSEA